MILTLLLASITVLATPAAAAAPGVKIKFEIEYLFQVEDPDSGGVGDGDYFPRVKIADGPLVTGPRIEDDEFEPFGLPEAPTGWTFTYENWPGDKPTVDITVAMWDYDSDFNSNSDRMDISPNNEDWELNLTYDLRSGTLSGDQLVFGTPCVWSDGRTAKGQSCIQGDGDHGIPRNNDGRITKIGITASAEMPDTDLDGIPDLIELSGIRNAAGNVLVDLPALGADPCRKTVILQLDYMEDAAPATRHSHEPKAGAITLVKNALDAAPIPATSPCPYAGPHRDGIDFIYRQGTQLAEQAQLGLNTNDFRNARTANFPAELAPYAHYGIFAHRLLNASGTSGQCCEPIRDNNKDFIVTLGDWRTICVADFTADYGGDGMLQTTAAGDDATNGTQIHVGNNRRCDTTSAHTTDVQVLTPGTGDADARVGTDQDQAGTILHELFHAMALRHGGNQNDNYKPNYVSVMNYFFQTGIPNSAPPLLVEEMRDWRKGAVRFGLSDGRLPQLPEGGLNETAGISDGADWTFWWAPNIANPANGPLLRAGAGNGPLNWNDNRTAGTNVPIIDTVNVPVNINDADGLTTLTDHDDWPAIRFRAQSPDRLGWACSSWPAGAPSCGGAGGVEEELSFDTAIRQEMSFFNLYDPDLAIAKTVDKADAEPDDTLTYQVKLDNIGTGGATQTSVKDTPPTGDVQTRQVGQLGTGGTKTESFTYVIPCDTEDGKVLTNKAEVSAKDLAGGAEANTANNTATATTTVHAPKLTLDKSAPPTVNAGEAMTIDLKVTNVGSGTATNVTLTDTLPSKVHYSQALDQGTGPRPSSVTANPDGTTTLTWLLGSLAGGASSGVQFTARPSLLFVAGNEIPDSAMVSYGNRNGCVYEPVTATASTSITEVAPTRNPWPQLSWQLHTDRQTTELLARIQATDSRFDGADGSAPDGALTRAEVKAVFALSISQSHLLRAQLLTTYLNLADRRINAATKIVSLVAAALELRSVGQAARHAQATLLLPDNLANLLRYGKATTVLTEINLNLSERY